MNPYKLKCIIELAYSLRTIPLTLFELVPELVDLVLRPRYAEDALVVAPVQVDDAHAAANHERDLLLGGLVGGT